MWTCLRSWSAAISRPAKIQRLEPSREYSLWPAIGVLLSSKPKNDMAIPELDAAKDANRVRNPEDNRSIVLPWLREAGMVDHLQSI